MQLVIIKFSNIPTGSFPGMLFCSAKILGMAEKKKGAC